MLIEFAKQTKTQAADQRRRLSCVPAVRCLVLNQTGYVSAAVS